MDEQVRILCVDDEVNVLRSIERIFLDDDYEIIKASSGYEGLEILQRVSPIQIVIADYRMPEMSGVEFLREVHDRWPDTVRIVLSGYADASTIVEAINEGRIYKFIPKPWNSQELKVTIENALERYFLNTRNKELTLELKRKNEELNRINSDLEKAVAEKTAEIMLHNRILRQAQTILRNLPIGVVAVNEDGVVIQCNREAERILSCPDIECPGTFLRDIMPLELDELPGGAGDSADDALKYEMKNNNLVRRMKIRKIEDASGNLSILVFNGSAD